MPIQVNQCEYASLIALGYFGSINKMRRDWEIDNNIISSTDFYKKLIEAGYTGAFPDMERDFWCDGGGSFALIKGWTDGFDCTGGGTNDVVVQFPQDISFLDQTDIEIYTSTDGGVTPIKTLTLPTPPTISPADTMNYGSNWSIPLVSTDVVYWKAGVNNTYSYNGKINEVKNGDFATNDTTDWTLQLADPVITYDASLGYILVKRNGSSIVPWIEQPMSAIPGTYTLTYTLPVNGKGNLWIIVDDNVVTLDASEVAGSYTYPDITIAGGNPVIRFESRGSTTSRMPLDNIILSNDLVELMGEQLIELTNCL